MRAIDLFCGAGGFALGFQQAGWKIVSANDVDSQAGDTFRINFPSTYFFSCPVDQLSVGQIVAQGGFSKGELDCIIGGPPCQSFSFNNHHRSASDERASLFRHYLRIVEGLLPKTLVMENVPGMVTIDGGRVLEEALLRLRSLGYNCSYKILSAEQFGVPQTRRRLFIFASRIGLSCDMIPQPTHWTEEYYRGKKNRVIERPISAKRPLVTIRNAIGDLPAIENGGGDSRRSYGSTMPSSDFQRYARKGSAELFNHNCHRLGPINLARILAVPMGGNWRSVPRDLLPAGMLRAKLSDHTKRYGRLEWDGLSATILTKCDPHWGAYVHPAQQRTISVREAARIQGFPDTFHFSGDSLTSHYVQVGNAVPVPLARQIASAISRHIEENKDHCAINSVCDLLVS